MYLLDIKPYSTLHRWWFLFFRFQIHWDFSNASLREITGQNLRTKHFQKYFLYESFKYVYIYKKIFSTAFQKFFFFGPQKISPLLENRKFSKIYFAIGILIKCLPTLKIIFNYRSKDFLFLGLKLLQFYRFWYNQFGRDQRSCKAIKPFQKYFCNRTLTGLHKL